MSAPRLIGVLIDLPQPALTSLAERWGAAATRKELYEAMRSGTSLAARVAGLTPAAQQLLRALAAEPLRLDDLLARVALGRESAERGLLELGELGLVVRVGAGGRGQPLVGGVGRERLAVPREIAAALSRAVAR